MTDLIISGTMNKKLWAVIAAEAVAKDFAIFRVIEDLIVLVARLKGRKVLIKGNHDDISDYRYKQLFSEICDYKEIIS